MLFPVGQETYLKILDHKKDFLNESIDSGNFCTTTLEENNKLVALAYRTIDNETRFLVDEYLYEDYIWDKMNERQSDCGTLQK